MDYLRIVDGVRLQNHHDVVLGFQDGRVCILVNRFKLNDEHLDSLVVGISLGYVFVFGP